MTAQHTLWTISGAWAGLAFVFFFAGLPDGWVAFAAACSLAALLTELHAAMATGRPANDTAVRMGAVTWRDSLARINDALEKARTALAEGDPDPNKVIRELNDQLREELRDRPGPLEKWKTALDSRVRHR